MLLEAEPEELKQLNIDYDSLEMYEAEIYQEDQGEDKEIVKNVILRRGFVTVISNYVVIFDTQNIEGRPSKSWLNIKQ